MQIADVVWTIPGNGPIYIQSAYYGSSGLLYNISNSYDSLIQKTTSALEIYSIGNTGSFTYTFSCNTYTNRNIPVCDSTATSSVTLIGYSTTTTTTTTTTTSTKILNSVSSINICLGGSWNSAQYVLLVLSVIITGIACLLFHYSFHGKKYNYKLC